MYSSIVYKYCTCRELSFNESTSESDMRQLYVLFEYHIPKWEMGNGKKNADKLFLHCLIPVRILKILGKKNKNKQYIFIEFY